MEPEHQVREARRVVVIGGGLAGSMAAIMLARRGVPVTVVEARNEDQPQKVVVGEALTEGSSIFLRHEIGMTDWLLDHTFRKFGFDFLIAPRHEDAPPRPRMEDCHELLLSLTPLEKIPAALDKLIPTYHVERPAMNQELAKRAIAAGAEYRWGTSVRKVDMGDRDHMVHVDSESGGDTIECAWVMDCTGRRAFLGKELGIHHRVEELPTAAIWNRFSNVCDDAERWTTFEGIDRRRHTIHFAGEGYWIWWIHQNSGSTSVGVSYDKRQHQPDVKRDDRGFWSMIEKFPAVADALKDAKAEEPYQYLAHLPYRSDHWISPRGYSLIGDAGWFADAVYSTAIETACRQLSASVPLVIEAATGSAPCEKTIAQLNEDFDFLQRAAVAHNKFKYEQGWHRPHTFFQVALYELSEIAELYNMQDEKRWTPEILRQHYRMQWGSEKRLRNLVAFMEGAARDGERDLRSPRLLKKSLSPGRVIYSATLPAWHLPNATPYFFIVTRLWGFIERMAQRVPLWPDFLSLMASPAPPRPALPSEPRDA